MGAPRDLSNDGPVVELAGLEELGDCPLRGLMSMREQYGAVFHYRFAGQDILFLDDAELIQDFLSKDVSHFGKADTAEMAMLRPMLGVGLMTTDGDLWRRQRAALQPFFQGAGLARMGGAMEAAVEEYWQSELREGKVDLLEAFSRLTLRVLTRCLFGVEGDLALDDFASSVFTMNEVCAHGAAMDHESMSRFGAARARIYEIAAELIEAVRRLPPEARGAFGAALAADVDERGDGGADRRLDQVVTFIMAGHETTAASLAWTVQLLLEHPEHLAAVRGEASLPVEDRRKTLAVVKESLRLYPPAWIMSRRSTREVSLGDVLIPAGWIVIFCPYVTHRNAAYWDRPDDFVPERAGRLDPRAYRPFGGGLRHCIGMQFAMRELLVTLPSLLASFDVEAEYGSGREFDALVTLRPKGGLPVRLSRRS
jgi:cytochrome P450